MSMSAHKLALIILVVIIAVQLGHGEPLKYLYRDDMDENIAASIGDHFPFDRIAYSGENSMQAILHKLSEPVPMAQNGLSQPVNMGFNIKCDDAKTNLSRDLDYWCKDFKCSGPLLKVSSTTPSEIACLNVGEKKTLLHWCMDRDIKYEENIPIIGDHRPVWPAYGEYTCVPPQRYLHNIEHGGVVMLYNPCADPLEVGRLRKIVTGCIRKHVIAAFKFIPEDKPLALIAWGCRYLMNSVDEDEVKNFIKKHALHGNEGHLSDDGSYRYGLLKNAAIPHGSDYDDSVLCP